MTSFDKYSLNRQVELALFAREMSGVQTFDVSRNRMPFTLSGTPPTWGQTAQMTPYISLNGVNDSIQCPAADSVAVNFTNEDFTLLIWVNADPSSSDMLLTQGVTDVDGWEFFVTDFNRTISLRTNQAGAHTDVAAVGCFTPNIWQQIVAVRRGAYAQVYINAVPAVMTLGAGLSDAVSVAGGDILYVGAKAAGNYLQGYVAGGRCGPRIWSRALSPMEVKSSFESERHSLGA